MRTRPELVEIAVNHLLTGRSGSIGTIRIDAAQMEQLRYEVTPHPHAHHRLIVDEPRERGGTDAGPSPLQVFLAGALTCLLNQIIKLLLARALAIETVSGILRGRVHHRVGGGFTDLVYDVHLTGEASDEALTTLAADAEQYCYVHNTLRNAVPLTVRLHLNGRQVAERVSRPTPSVHESSLHKPGSG